MTVYPSGFILEVTRSAGLEPKQRGDELVVPCPWPENHKHGDADPSCRLSPEKNTFYCDPCGNGGGVKDLARALGVDLRELSGFNATSARKPPMKRRLTFVSSGPVSTEVRNLFADQLTKPYDPETWAAFGVLEGSVHVEGRPEKTDEAIGFPLVDGGYHVYRFRNSNKKQRWRFSDGGKAGLITAGLDRDGVVILAEGEWDAMRAYALGYAVATSTGGASTFRKSWVTNLEPRSYVVIYDTDTAGRNGSAKVTAALQQAGLPYSEVLLEFDDEADGNDLSDFVAAYGEERFREVVTEAHEAVSRGDGSCSAAAVNRESQADRLVRYALGSGVHLFHNELEEGFVRVPVKAHLETWRCKSKPFKQWLAYTFWMCEKKAAKSDVVNTAVAVLEAQARFEGQEHELAVRVAQTADGLWYDLCDSKWRAVHITGIGWSIVDEPPILFSRRSHEQPQVDPVHGGDLHDLLRLVNLADPASEILVLVFVVGALVEGIPRPIPMVHGPQGAAKTTLIRMLRRLIDPSSTETLSLPTKLNELVQQLSHHYFIPYDNITSMPIWASDTLCRAVTGEGFSKRELYTDDDDVIFTFRRCLALNGINVAARRPDLLDRSILIRLDGISEKQRRPEREIWSEFERMRPRLVGAMFDALSKAMTIRPTVQLHSSPRMADFAFWGAAIAEALGHSRDEFLDAYQDNYSARNEEALASSPVATVLQLFMADRDLWEGTPTELLKALQKFAGENGIDSKGGGFPREPNVLTRRINDVKPNLDAVGLHVSTIRSDAMRRLRVERSSRNTVTTVTRPELTTAQQVTRDDICDGSNRESSCEPSPRKPLDSGVCDASDGDDDISGTSRLDDELAL